MKYVILSAILFFTACKETAVEQLKKELNNHLQPRDSILNKLPFDKTFVLESSERNGVDNERFKQFDYWKEIDKSYFVHVADKEYSDPDEAGGISTTLSIYKAIKRGTTEIKFYKRKYYTPRYLSDTTKIDTSSTLYSTYKFIIE